MTIGFTTSATYGAIDITPDKGLSRKASPRIRVAKFGDGYEQRIVDGINSIEESYTVNFNNRTKEVIDDIVGYFETLGSDSFDFTIPDSNQLSNTSPNTAGERIIKVVCGQYSLNYDNHPVSYSCNATFRRVYEA
jgi:phage-related protein